MRRASLDGARGNVDKADNVDVIDDVEIDDVAEFETRLHEALASSPWVVGAALGCAAVPLPPPCALASSSHAVDGLPAAWQDLVCSVCASPPRVHATPHVSRDVATLWLLDCNPGCRVDGCATCTHWCDAVRDVGARVLAPDMSRSVLFRVLTLVCEDAVRRGFHAHLACVNIDRAEEFSSEPAPDSPPLRDALRDAQLEADTHAASPPAPPINPSPTSFSSSNILDDLGKLSRGRPTDDTAWSDAECCAVLKLIAEDIVCGALVAEDPLRPCVIFLPRGVKPRVCIDLRPINMCMRASSVRYPAARDLAAARKTWHVKLDLKAAFKSVGLPSCVHRLLGFVVGGLSFTYTRLPFGWSWSPEIFSATLLSTLEALRVSLPDCAIVAYVDDICIAHNDAAACVRAATEVMRVLRTAGFRVSVDKTFLRPVRVVRFLGMLVAGGRHPRIGVCPAIVTKCWAALERTRVSGCSWAVVKLWGLVSFAAQAVPSLALYRNSLDAFASSVSRNCCASFHPDVRSAAYTPLLSLLHDACIRVGVAAAAGLHPISRSWRSKVAHLVTDASSSGFAARLWIGELSLPFESAFSVAECSLSSTARELLALARSLRHFARLLHETSIVWQSDSSAGVAIAASISSSSDACRIAITEAHHILSDLDSSLEAVWSPRTHPDLAEVDERSRSPPAGGLGVQFSAEALGRAVRTSATPPTLHHDPLPRTCMAPRYSSSLPLGPADRDVQTARYTPATVHARGAVVEVLSHPVLNVLDGVARGDVLIHCVSSDFRMSRGLALDVRRLYPGFAPEGVSVGCAAVQFVEPGAWVVHMVTKVAARDKPTMDTLMTALQDAVRRIQALRGARRIRLPRVGCGLDRLLWTDVRPRALRTLARCRLPVHVFEIETAPLPAFSIPCAPPAVCGAGMRAQWRGSPVTTEWAGEAVLIAPTAAELPHVVDRFLAAAARAPSVLMLVSTDHARVSVPALRVLDTLCASDVMIVPRGGPLLALSAAGEWVPSRAEREWRVRTFFGSPAVSPWTRVLSRAELLALLHASGFPPNPGPPRKRSIEEALAQGAAEADCDSWDALAVARDLAASTPFSPPVVPTLRMFLEACASPSSAHASAMMQAAGWLHAYGPTDTQVLHAVDEIDGCRTSGTVARATRTALSMLRLATTLGSAEMPYTTESLDGLACAWVRARLRLPHAPPFADASPDLPPPSAPAVAADCSALAARARRLFLPCADRLPPGTTGLGPVSAALLAARGSGARHDASPKRVVWGWELRWGLEENPEVAVLHPGAVAAICMMGATMWRSRYVRLLRRCDAYRLPDGNIAARWVHRHKVNRAVGEGLPSTPKFAFISCPWVRALLDPLVPSERTDDTTPLFTDDQGRAVSYAYLARVLRMLLAGLPGAASATLHGIRVGCDSELKALGVPDIIRDMMGWWKLACRRMSQHYEALQLAEYYAASNKYGSSVHTSLAPGVMATVGEFGGARHVSFDRDISLFTNPGAPRAPVVRDTAVEIARAIIHSHPLPGSAAPPLPPASPLIPDSVPTDSAAPAASLRKPALSPAAAAGIHASVPLSAAASVALARWRDTGGPAIAAAVRRCGYCRLEGHRKPTCPALNLLTNEPGDDASESDGEDEADESAAVASLAVLPPPATGCRVLGASLAALYLKR